METGTAPNRLVVIASYDPDGLVAPHVEHQVRAWQGACRTLIVVTTSTLTEQARQWLTAHAVLIERENHGYDFYSYRTGLAAAGDLAEYDEVVICNDTFVGPLRPYPEIFAGMQHKSADFWGITCSRRISPHIQSFFVVFSHQVVASAAFRRFWQEMEPTSDRRQVIHRYEVGLSRTLVDAGFTMNSYFAEHLPERWRARLRVAWWALHLKNTPRKFGPWRRRAAEPWNPTYALADSALHHARLPLVKLDVLRTDPYNLDAAGLLRRCLHRHPVAFAGVVQYLERTAPSYRPRKSDALRRTPRSLRAIQRLLAYR